MIGFAICGLTYKLCLFPWTTELNNAKWYVTAQRMGTWAQARAVQNSFDSQVNIFLVFNLKNKAVV